MRYSAWYDIDNEITFHQRPNNIEVLNNYFRSSFNNLQNPYGFFFACHPTCRTKWKMLVLFIIMKTAINRESLTETDWFFTLKLSRRLIGVIAVK